MPNRLSFTPALLSLNALSGGAVLLCVAGAIATHVLAGAPDGWLLPWAALAFLSLFGIRLCSPWERAVVLRLGRLHGVRGPGPFLIVPFIDTITEIVDNRLHTTPVRTEQTLTRDAASIDVDAVVFWMVHDPIRAVTELDDYENSVELVALTTLREIVSSADLGRLLENRREIDETLRDLVDRKTSDWGITIQAVEIRDVALPAALQDAMSRQAQAKRERAARITLASAERAVALELAEAARTYDATPTALQILQINRIFEMNKDRGTTILMPTTMADSMASVAAPIALRREAGEAPRSSLNDQGCGP